MHVWGALPFVLQVPQIQDLLAVGSVAALAPSKKAGVFGPGNEFFYTGKSTFVNYAGCVLRGCLDCGLEEVRGCDWAGVCHTDLVSCVCMCGGLPEPCGQ